jgi:hypothetical protein
MIPCVFHIEGEVIVPISGGGDQSVPHIGIEAGVSSLQDVGDDAAAAALADRGACDGHGDDAVLGGGIGGGDRISTRLVKSWGSPLPGRTESLLIVIVGTSLRSVP